MKITDNPRCEYPFFDRVLTIPPGTFEVFSKKLLLESICGRVNQSLDELFGGILKDPRGFSWAVVCTPDKADDSDYFSLSGMMGCNDAAGELQTGQIGKRGFMDAFHDDSPHPGLDVLELLRESIADTPAVAELLDRMRAEFRAEWETVERMFPLYLNALAEIKQYRMQNAVDAQENALEKRQKALLESAGGTDSFGRRMGMRVGLAAGGLPGAIVAKHLPKVTSNIASGIASMSASQAASRAEKDVTAWNISGDELGFFSSMDFYAWAKRIRSIVSDYYAELKRVALDILVHREIPGWGSIAAMEETASALKDKVTETFDQDLCCSYMCARPHDVDMALDIVSRYGAEAGGLRELQLDFGMPWTEKCDARVSELCVDANPADENDVKTRLGILTEIFIPGFYAGRSDFAEAKANRLRTMLEQLDLQARTVGEMVCTTREAAAAARAEKGEVDALLAGGKKYPFAELEKLLAALGNAPFKSEYYQWVMEELRRHRSFMLTVAGVEYPTWEEAQKAFDAKVEETGKKKLASFVLRVSTLGRDRQALAAMYWPGSMDPGSLLSKVRDLKNAPDKLVSLATNPSKQAFLKMDSFLQEHVSAYGDARKKIIAKTQDIADVTKHNLQSGDGADTEQSKNLSDIVIKSVKNPFKAYKQLFSQMGAATSAVMQVCGPKANQDRADGSNPPKNN